MSAQEDKQLEMARRLQQMTQLTKKSEQDDNQRKLAGKLQNNSPK